MVNIMIPAIQGSSGGGGSGVYPDVPYPILNQRIGIFNKPNAWDTDSNGWFGLLGNSVAGICNQNYNFNQQIAVALDSGVGALSTRVKSYAFSTSIVTVDAGQIIFGLMNRGTTFFNINETSKKIKDIYAPLSTISIPGSNEHIAKSFIVTSGGNRFLCINDRAVYGSAKRHLISSLYPIDANNRITSATPTDVLLGNIIAVVGNHVRTYYNNNDNMGSGECSGKIYSINSSGIKTLVNSTGLAGMAYYFQSGYVSYQESNAVAHFCFLQSNTTPTYSFEYITIDLTNTAVFTKTSIYSVGSNISFSSLIGGFDGTGLLIVSGTDIKRVTVGGISASLGTYCVSGNNKMAKSNTLSYYTSKSNNICTDDTSLNILGSTVGGDSVTSIYSKLTYVYEQTGALSQDDSFIGIITDLVPIGETDALTLSVNGTITNTLDNQLYNFGYGNKFTLLEISIGVPEIEIQIDYVNSLGNDLKLGIGITGGTYASPTLPSNNGMSAGSATVARTAGSTASYMDITLSA